MTTCKPKMNNYTLKVEDSNYNKVQITSSKQAEKTIRQFYHDDIEIYESFFILLMNRNNDTIGHAKISQGGITGTVIDRKIITKYCVDSLASGVILAHNHPSGNTNPSHSDKTITTSLKECLKLFDVDVLDHIILTKDNYYSFADENNI